jgi:hypothetical protein
MWDDDETTEEDRRFVRNDLRESVTAALAAALPIIRRDIAEEIEARRVHAPGNPCDVCYGVRHAAEIIRGAS